MARIHAGVRFRKALHDQVLAEVELLAAENPGVRVTKSMVYNQLLEDALLARQRARLGTNLTSVPQRNLRHDS